MRTTIKSGYSEGLTIAIGKSCGKSPGLKLPGTEGVLCHHPGAARYQDSLRAVWLPHAQGEGKGLEGKGRRRKEPQKKLQAST